MKSQNNLKNSKKKEKKYYIKKTKKKKTKSHCLKIGGYLINFGPLLYHFEDMNDPSIELTWEEIYNNFENFGFKLIETPNTDMKSSYTQNKKSLLQRNYQCIFFVAKKIRNVKTDIVNIDYSKMRQKYEGQKDNMKSKQNNNKNFKFKRITTVKDGHTHTHSTLTHTHD